jgi:thioredoxin type arsenate reductase
MRYLPGMQDGNGTRRPGVLFLCVANSGRSQMAEGFARVYAPPGIEVWSAGSEPRQVHPLAVAVMAEEGIDLAGQRSKGVGEVPVDRIGTVVTLCAEEVCPTFPGSVRRLHWPLPDPAAADGNDEERRATFRAVRDEIHGRVAGLFR